MQQVPLRVTITVAATVLGVAQISLPDLKIDSITVGLFVLAILPWLAALIQRAKLPGGWEITFRDVQDAGRRAAPAKGGDDRAKPSLPFSVLEVADLDANLALVYLRIEIEQRLRIIAERAELNSTGSLARLFRDLRRSRIIDDAAFSGLEELIHAGNQAAHGAQVEPSVRDSVLQLAPSIINALDQLIDGFAEEE